MERAVYVYRIKIKYPEASHEKGWRPALWSEPEYLATLSKADRVKLKWKRFKWPRERRFLSSHSAYHRAWWLGQWGAQVEIQRSMPVLWEEDHPELVWDAEDGFFLDGWPIGEPVGPDLTIWITDPKNPSLVAWPDGTPIGSAS